MSRAALTQPILNMLSAVYLVFTQFMTPFHHFTSMAVC